GKEKYIIEINFDTKNEKISLLSKEYSQGDEYKYNFVKMSLTGRQKQPFVVFGDKKRIYGEKNKSYSRWTSLKDEIEDMELKQKILEVEKIFYDGDLLKDNYKETIENYLKQNNIKEKEIAFWAVKIDGEDIHNNESYLKLIERKVLEDKSQKGKIICHFCSKETKKFFTDFSRLKMKIYINDKVGFSQNISNDWQGNFALCENCYKILIKGQSFILNKFSSKVGSINYLIIPEFIKEPKLNKNKLEKWSEYIKFYKNPFEFFNMEFEKKIEEYREFEDYDNFVLLNYLFYEQNKQQFKVFALIKDIPNGRIEKIKQKIIDIRRSFGNFINDEGYLIKNLSDFYYLVEFVDIQKIVSLFLLYYLMKVLLKLVI
ncbi:MAG: TM1802 family CRISPR-associated protein, partial [candidate division WOR-3 bacterium]